MNTTQEKKAGTSHGDYRCLHCHGRLAELQKGKHCASPTCDWLKCACGAVNDVKRKLATHKEHGMACQSDNAPCRMRTV